MSEDKQKTVRFSPKPGTVQSASGSIASEGSKSSIFVNVTENADVNLLTIKNDQSDHSISSEVNQEGDNSTVAEPITSVSPDPTSHTQSDDTTQAYGEPNHYFIQTIVNPTEKVITLPPPLREFPPSLNELITQLEVEGLAQPLTETHPEPRYEQPPEPTMETTRSLTGTHEYELKELTARLHAYIKKMRELRGGAVELDSHNFFKSVDAMEREMSSMRGIYEKEITKLRQQTEEMTRQQHQLQLQNSKLEASASELQSRLAVEVQKGSSLSMEISSLQKEFYQKEVEFQRSMQEVMSSSSTQVDVNATNRKLEQTLRENMDLHRRYDAEMLLRRENEEKVHQLQEQITFNISVNKQQQQELQERLAAANMSIINLEGKIRVLDKPGSETNIGEMLTKIKEAAERDIRLYKEEAEAMFAKNVSMLQAQMTADKGTMESVTDENRQLQVIIEDLRGQIRNLQGEVAHVMHIKRTAEESVVTERQRSTNHIRIMEGKLKDIQDMLFDKMKELNAVRVETLPLRAEVESLRALLTEEERRLEMEISKLPPISSSNLLSAEGTSQIYSTSQSYGINTAAAAATSAEFSQAKADSMARTGTMETMSPSHTLAFDTTRYATSGSEAMRLGSSSNKLVGPIRNKSAQCASYEVEDKVNVLENNGGDTDVEIECAETNSSPKPSNVVSHDYNQSTNSATGYIRIFEVSTDGKSIRLVNTSSDEDVEFGGYALKQQVGGCPVALYRFPPKTVFAAKSYITIYSGCNDAILHQPPTQFVWKEQDRWGTGPECTTILCKPNGQAIAWTTAAHRFGEVSMAYEGKNENCLSSELPTFTRNPNAARSETLFLKRQKETAPSLSPQKQPHGNMYCAVHSSYNETRVKQLGNDNSSNHRQTRCQTVAVPDRVPGEPYAGIKGQTMGSSTMRRYTPLNSKSGNVRKNGSITNRVDGNLGETSESPNPFMTAKQRHLFGVQQIQSQHHQQFNPPMPRPPLFCTW